jgi:hypothetical protein
MNRSIVSVMVGFFRDRMSRVFDKAALEVFRKDIGLVSKLK